MSLFGPMAFWIDNGSLSAQSWRASISGDADAAAAEFIRPHDAARAAKILLGTMMSLHRNYGACPIIVNDRYPTRKLNQYNLYKASRFERYEKTYFTAEAGLKEVPEGEKASQHQQFRAYMNGIFRTLPVIQCHSPGEEADDAIGTGVCTLGRVTGTKHYVFTRDTDMLQLIAKKNCTVVLKHGGMPTAQMMGPNDAMKKYGVRPDQIPLYKALLGDAGDGIPNLYRMHAKNVVRDLIGDRTTVQEVYDAWWWDQISQEGWHKPWEDTVSDWLGPWIEPDAPNVADRFKAQAFVNEKLARLREDCPMVYEYTGGDYNLFMERYNELMHHDRSDSLDAMQVWNACALWAGQLIKVFEKDQIPLSNPGFLG